MLKFPIIFLAAAAVERFVTSSTTTAENFTTIAYLKRYGYLPNDNDRRNESSSHSQETFRNAIRRLQRFGGLRETGELNSETLRLMEKPRCGLPDNDILTNNSDISSLMNANNGRWFTKHLSWSLKNSARTLSYESCDKEISDGFNWWQKYTKFRFYKTHSRYANSDIRLSFEARKHNDGGDFDGSGGELAHALFPQRTIGSFVHFDNDEPWIAGNGSGPDLFSVTIHELGHSLGLKHSDDVHSFMNPFYVKVDKGYVIPRHELKRLNDMYEFLFRDDAPSSLPSQPSPPRSPEIKPEITTTAMSVPRQRPIPRPPSPSLPSPPPPYFPVEFKFDFTLVARGEMFVFKGPYLWRFSRPRFVNMHPAIVTSTMFRFGHYVDRLDAGYERFDGGITFFRGSLYYVFYGRDLAPGYPRTLTQLGLPRSVNRIIGATPRGDRRRVYFISDKGEMFLYDDRKNVLIERVGTLNSVYNGAENSLHSDIRATNREDDEDYYYYEKPASSSATSSSSSSMNRKIINTLIALLGLLKLRY